MLQEYCIRIMMWLDVKLRIVSARSFYLQRHTSAYGITQRGENKRCIPHHHVRRSSSSIGRDNNMPIILSLFGSINGDRMVFILSKKRSIMCIYQIEQIIIISQIVITSRTSLASPLPYIPDIATFAYIVCTHQHITCQQKRVVRGKNMIYMIYSAHSSPSIVLHRNESVCLIVC